MTKGRNLLIGSLCCLGMFIIILDGMTATESIREGIDVCLRTVIPALLPFFILSKILNNYLLGQRLRFMRPVQRLCRIPRGSESILMIGLLSGYPVGAQLVKDAYTDGSISKADAERMLGFCSNAGPAFIFGIIANAFANTFVPWAIWGIHIISALAAGWVLPGRSSEQCILPKQNQITITKSLHSAVRNLVAVCSWVILFRLILTFLKKWLLLVLPLELQTLITGTTELTNGSIMLYQLGNDGIKFILAAAMLSFGGLCVTMQTASVAAPLRMRYYFWGKLLQTFVSIVLSYLLLPLLFSEQADVNIPKEYMILTVLCTVSVIYLHRRKKVVAFPRSMLYNISKRT